MQWCTAAEYVNTHTCSQVQDTVVLVIDRQHDVRNHVGNLVVSGQVERGHSNGSDHILNLWVVPDHSKVLDVVGSFWAGVFADALGKEAMVS